jgi:hypothetical protein
MRANEVIDCELRSNGLHITSYRHAGKITANCFVVHESGGDTSFAIDGGIREFVDEHALEEFARDTVIPCLIRMYKRRQENLPYVPIHANVCDISIGLESPNFYS